MRDLVADAQRLRSLHGAPLVLANAWDPATARVVEHVGFPAVATSSAAVAASLGATDADSLDPDLAFAAVASVAAAVSVPVSADLEAGYGLAPEPFVERLLAAGAVGCNIEDTDHHGAGGLVAAEPHAQRLHAIKEAGRAAGVDIVVNARVDAYAHRAGSAEEQLAETLRRGRMYRDAGADCVYPILLADAAHIETLVRELGAINVLLRPGAPDVGALRALGVARISVGSGLFRLAMAKVRSAAEGLFAGSPGWSA